MIVVSSPIARKNFRGCIKSNNGTEDYKKIEIPFKHNKMIVLLSYDKSSILKGASTNKTNAKIRIHKYLRRKDRGSWWDNDIGDL